MRFQQSDFATTTFDDAKPVVAAAGIDFEARLAYGPGVIVIYGQNRRKFLEDLDRLGGLGVRGFISFGIAGGISPNLGPGHIVVADRVITRSNIFRTCPDWSKSLLSALPHAHHLPVFGADAPVMTVLEKAALWSATAVGAVDMESGMVAEVAARHNLPFAVLRVVLDPAHRPVPPSALAGAGADGKTNAKAVARALMKRPQDLRGLLRLVGDSRKAMSSLLSSRQSLGPFFGLADALELPLDVE